MVEVSDFFSNLKGSNISHKNKDQRLLINQALYILKSLGIPLPGKSKRALEKMALAFLAVLDVKKTSGWPKAKDANNALSLKTRDIINWINTNFSENISSGSYDDIRRKDLKHLILAEIVIRSKPDSDRNDPTRAYFLNPEYSPLIRSFGSANWKEKVETFFEARIKLTDKLSVQRNINHVPISISTGKTLSFSPGVHNQLQKDIIEKFLPRYGFGAEILYVGDAADKFKYVAKERLQELNFFELSSGELPDVIAYSSVKNWLYLVEAVKSSGPISPERHYQLKELTSECKADIIFVTAFPDRTTFRKFVADISWETEVWIADAPDHLIHFNGDKFLGPYKPGE